MDTFVSEIKLTEHDHEIEHDYRDRACVDLFTAMARERQFENCNGSVYRIELFVTFEYHPTIRKDATAKRSNRHPDSLDPACARFEKN